VSDRNGHPVLDITPDEFEIAEEGVLQEIVSMALVQAGSSGFSVSPGLEAVRHFFQDDVCGADVVLNAVQLVRP
jgi:hypothetical protein